MENIWLIECKWANGKYGEWKHVREFFNIEGVSTDCLFFSAEQAESEAERIQSEHQLNLDGEVNLQYRAVKYTRMEGL